MRKLSEMIEAVKSEGYSDADAQAKVCQDIVLKGIASSPLCRKATIKGGVVMRSIYGNNRRATQDMDIDFIRYSLSDESISGFIKAINNIDGISISQTGEIEELKQQDYHGKRVFITVSDEFGDAIDSKIDLGVHKNLSINQEEYCFDIASLHDSVCLLINSKEQMFSEKLRSLLKFGSLSTRYKDIYDMCFLSESLKTDELLKCLDTFIFSSPDMRENDISDIIRRVDKTLADMSYIKKLSSSEKNWLDIKPKEAAEKLLLFLRQL